MPHTTTIVRRKMKEEEPEKYEEFRRKQRERDNIRNALKRKSWEEDTHTRAQLLQRQEKIEAKRAKDRERYHAKKSVLKRSTRASCAAPQACATPQAASKKPRDMSPDEYRAYRAHQKRVQRSKMSYQKKTALKLKRREKWRQERIEKLTHPNLDAAGPSLAMRLIDQSLNNLKFELPKENRMEREELNNIFGTYDPQQAITNDLLIRFYKEAFSRNVSYFESAAWLWTWIGRRPETCSCLQTIKSNISRIVGKASKLKGNRLKQFKQEEFHLPTEITQQPITHESVNEIDIIPVLPLPCELEQSLSASRIEQPEPKKEVNVMQPITLKRQEELDIIEGKLQKAKEEMGEEEKRTSNYSIANVKRREEHEKEIRTSLREEINKLRDVMRSQQKEITFIKRSLEEKEERIKFLERKIIKMEEVSVKAESGLKADTEEESVF